MISSSETAQGLTIVARPNHSSSWRRNQGVLLLIAVPSLTAAIAFAGLGAWPILPLAGLELLALGSALYYVNWKLEYRHIITLGADTVRIEKGFYRPVHCWQLPRAAARLTVTPERHPWDGPALAVAGPEAVIPIGDFLNREDSLSLLALLRRELRVSSWSAPASRQL